LSGSEYERIFKTKAPASEVYFACCDFKEVDSKATLDLDFFMHATPAGLEPFHIVIHKENGKPRLTYPPTK
jgi:hypothetical protein